MLLRYFLKCLSATFCHLCADDARSRYKYLLHDANKNMSGYLKKYDDIAEEG